jgi:pimeloyl-ACP methyl ester carboxylesterase
MWHLFGPWSDIWQRSGWRVQTHCNRDAARVLDPVGRRVMAGTPEACLAFAVQAAPATRAKRAVLLLHGLFDGPEIMARLAGSLRVDGRAVANAGYPSRRLGLTAHGAAASAVARALAEDGAERVDVVGHSLGGLVARAAMARAAQDGWTPGRLVLLGSPAGGSLVAERLSGVPGYPALVGACAAAVTSAGAARLPPPIAAGVFVIAGGTGRRGYNPLIPGDNDGLIRVAETRLAGAESGFLLVPSLHRFLPARRTVIEACGAFLDG